MAVPEHLMASATRSYFNPEFHAVEKAKRVKLVAKLRPQWPLQAKLGRKLPSKNLLEIVREQSAAYRNLAEERRAVYLTRCATQVFRDGTDLLAPHPHQLPNVNEAILTMAEFVLRINQPILAKHGFSEGVAGLAELDQMLFQEEIRDQSLVDAVAEYYHQLCFGTGSDLQELPLKEAQSIRYTSHITWMGILAVATPILGSFMSYLHHLALPPLERRLQSYARTIAVSEAILAQQLQQYRQLRVTRQLEGKHDKKDRIIWIFHAEDHDLAQLARGGYFEDAAAFKNDYDTMTIYLWSPTTTADKFTGSWPYGHNVKVYAISDHDSYDAGAPELAYLFHFNPDNKTHIETLTWLSAWSLEVFRPVTVLTCRCEAECRRTKDILDWLGLTVAWPFTDTPGVVQRENIFVRNLYSGMAGNPDIDYDDNGWMAAVFQSHKPKDIRQWAVDPQNFHDTLEQVREFNKQRVKWTEMWIRLCSSREGLLSRCGDPSPGDEFTREHLIESQAAFNSYHTHIGDLVMSGLLEVIPAEETGEELEEVPKQVPPEEGQEEEYRVAYQRVILRSEPSTKAAAVGIYNQDSILRGVLVDIDGVRWLRIAHTRKGTPGTSEAWMLVDGSHLGLGLLLERIGPVKAQDGKSPKAQESKEKEAEAADGRDGSAKPQRSGRSPVVFWGILDLKYNSNKRIEDLVKVLETGDGRLSRFSGCGASIKESFQQEHKLEEALRRETLTENKKLTHDVIVDHGYGHLRPRQKEFRREYTPALTDTIKKELNLVDEDICVLKLCNRARGAGVIPVKVADLDEVLQELLRPPSDLKAWFRQQRSDWYRTVTPGCWEEQVRHWWSNECPCFLVEECCVSMPTEKDERYFDGTMRVGFSLHREHRNRLPPGWVDSPQGPVRVQKADEDHRDASNDPRPTPWNDDRPYLDLFRLETSILRVQWLGGYWKLPIEDIDSQELRDKIVSVAKQGTSPVPDTDLHAVYAAVGDMVPLLFGSNDMSQGTIRARYKSFPELGAFIVARQAVSVRFSDKSKSSQLMALAKMYMDKEEGACKDFVTSYIHRQSGIAEAGLRTPQWVSAAEHFRKSMQKMPTNANSRHLLGLHYLEQGDPKTAVLSFEEALLLDPDFKAPYACLGVAHLRMAQYAEAAQVSQDGLKRHPHTPACQYNLGLACFSQAVRQEQQFGGGAALGYIATQMRARALEALETARDQRFRWDTWEARDDAMIAKLRNENEPLAWSERKLPTDGWKVSGWRPGGL